MSVPFWDGFETGDCAGMYAVEPRPKNKQTAAMMRTPARDCVFMAAPSRPRRILWTAVKEYTSSKWERLVEG